VAPRLRAAAAVMPHVSQVGTAVLNSLRTTGGVEGIQTFVWLAAAATVRFDATSHIVPSYQVGSDCNLYATKPVEACSAHWAGSAADTAQASAKRAHKRHKAKRRHRKRKQPEAGPDGSAPAGSEPSPQAGPLPSLPKLPDLPPLPGIKPPDLPGSGSGDRDDASDKLLDFLMGK
jgi:hypothetical protein